MSSEKIIRYGMADPQAGGQRRPFSKAVRAGDFVYVSGQVPTVGGEVVTGNIVVQTEQVIANIREVLALAGCTLADVVKVNVWLDDARIAIWNVGNWDDDGFADCMYAPGVVIFDIHVPRPDEGHSGQVWPMPDLPRARHLHCVNGRLMVVGEGQSWLWNVDTRKQLAHWPDFAPQGWHEQRQQLLEWSAQQIKVVDAKNAF